LISRIRGLRRTVAAVSLAGTVTTAGGCVTRVPQPPTPVSPSASSRLQQVLLTEQDLPGFTVAPAADDGQSTPGCPDLDSDYVAGSSATAEVVLTNPARVSIRERLRQFDPSTAEAVIARIRGVPRACPSFGGTAATMGPLTFTATGLSVPRLGDETTALRLTIKVKVGSADITLFQDLVAVRHGGTVLFVAHVSPLAADDKVTTSATARAYAKMSALW
jgi:hypothetical protein